MARVRGALVGLIRVALVVLAALAALPACSGDASGDEAEACNALVNDGPQVPYSAVAGEAPVPGGGTIADGTYVLSALNLYGELPVPDRVARAVFEIAGTSMQQVGDIDGDEQRYTSTFSTSGTLISIDDTCPEPNNDTANYTATPTELRLVARVESGTLSGTLEMALSKR